MMLLRAFLIVLLSSPAGPAAASPAAAELGADFDIRAVHDLALSNGAIPLDSLERLVDEWLEGRRGG